jgi:amino acid adenylation domain-containing protein
VLATIRIESRVAGRLDVRAVEAALAAVAVRHEILRTTFPVPAGMSLPGQAVQGEPEPPRLDLRDLSGLAPGDREAAAERLWEELSARPFQPDCRPPLAAALAVLGPESHLLFLAVHALCADEASLGVLVHDLRQALEGKIHAAEPPAQYADVAAALDELLESDETEAGRAYWREVLPAAQPAGRLPFEREPGSAVPFAPRRVEGAAVDPALAARIESLAESRSAPPSAVLLAAWQALLARLAPEADRVMGTELAGRHFEGLETAIGPFARCVPVRAAVRPGDSFAELVSRLGERIASIAEWQDFFSWESVPGGEESFFPAVFRFSEEGLDSGEDGEAAGVRCRLERSWACTDRFRLRLAVRRAVEEGALRIELGYDAARFRERDVRTLLASWRALLEGAVAAPDVPIAELELVGPEVRRYLLVDLNATEHPFDPVAVHHLFFEQARRTPEAVALSTWPSGETVTYGELARRTVILAESLRRAGVGPEVPVALFVERSVEMVVGVLAVLAAGGAYVPLDPSHPPARLALVLEGSGAPVLLTHGRLLDRLPNGLSATVMDLDAGPPETREELKDLGGRLCPGPSGENAAYILFTSGSTGTPKGVVVRHRALTHHMLWMQAAFPLRPGDRVLQKTPLSFDASVWEVFAPLLAGAELALAEPDAHRDPARLARITAGSAATVLQVVPSLLRLLLGEEAFAACTPLRRLFCGGEPLSAELRDRVHALLPGAELVNLYGPTETTVQVASQVAGRGGASVPGETVPIGRPIHNARIYVLDAGMRLVPPGLPGELWIGGEPLSRGYLGRPGLTAASFLPDPFAEEPGARLYKTGDLGRTLDDGSLELLGRAGLEIKIRGYRFDPGEIEDLLSREEGVREAAVLAREDRPGEQRLVAFVAPGGEPAVLRARLAERLPDYLVPSVFVTLAALPRTPSGKLDRTALSALPEESGEAGSSGLAAPRTAIEEMLAGIWADLLGRDRVGAHDDFFGLGGHSLLGAQLVARVRQALGVELSLRTVFETPTVAGLASQVAAALQGADAPPPPPIVPVPRDGEIPLSFAQQRLWLLDRLTPGDPSYNVTSAVRFTGRLDQRALLAAFREIVRVQEALRTTFPAVEGRPVQRPAPALALDLPVAHLAALPPEMRLAEALRLAAEEARRPFDLAQGPLLRLTLLRLGPADSLLLTGMHHIVSDAWSVGILYRDLMALYTAAVSGLPAVLPEPPIQCIDYAVWQRRWFEQVREGELAWWRRRLAGLPVLHLPADRPRPPQPAFGGHALPFSLPGAASEALRHLARAESVTLFMLLLAAFQALLQRWSGQDEIVVGAPVANRERAEIEGLVGFFVNTLVLRTSLAGDPTLRELLARVREVAVGAYAHQGVPFEVLVEDLAPERDLGRQPLFQVMFQLQTVPLPRFAIPGVEVEPLDVDPGAAPFDLGLDLAETPDGLAGVLRASTDLFDAPTLIRLLGHLRTLLTAAAADPGLHLAELPLLTGAERHQIAVEWNDNAQPYETGRCIHELFAAQAACSPDAEALTFADRRLTYAELEAGANRLARHLLRYGPAGGAGARVALRMESSADLFLCMLAILKAGAAYVPLDPSFPETRTALLLEEAEASVLIVRRRLEIPACCPVLCLEDEQEEIARHSPDPLPPLAVPESLAYVLFTSGSTGRPKGVGVPHRAVVRLVRGTGCLPAGPGDRIAQVSNISFDSLTFEIWGALLNGGCLVGLPRDVLLSPRALAAYLRRERISIFLSPTALLHQIAREEPAAFRTVRHLTAGGEALDARRARDLLIAGGPGHLFNVYGPTETTCFVTWEPIEEVPEGALTVPLGRPIGNTLLLVLDRALAPVPIGVEGELCVGGEALARGYLGQPALTAERFVPDPVGGVGTRLYRTGDRARLLPDGRVEFLGRLDGQVKVRGFRIEPGEVEAALARHPDVAAAVVLPREEEGGRRLVAIIVPASGTPEDVDPAALRAFLRQRLPEFMIPSFFVALPGLPLNSNNKVDRAALARSPLTSEPAAKAGAGLASPVEEMLAGIWAEVLGLRRVDRLDNFFELSGHSLLAAQVAYRIQQVFAVDIPLRRLFERATLAELAREVEEARHAPSLPPLERAPRDRPVPASFYQEWAWRAQGGPVSARYNISLALRLRGPLDPAALRRSLDEIVRRHEVLRTGLRPDGGGLLQEVYPAAELPLPVVDLAGLPDAVREERLQILVHEEARQPFDLRCAPLLRVSLVRLGGEDHVVTLCLHHAIADGWSIQLLQRELKTLYSAFSRGLPSPLPPLLFQHADFAHWQRRVLEGEPIQAELAWWRRRLAGAPPPPDLRSRRPRPDRLGPKAASAALPLPPVLTADLRALARAEGCTVSMALLTGLAALVHQDTGREDLLIATVLAGRSRPELSGVVGLLMNTVPLRADLSGAPGFREILLRVRGEVLDSYGHQDVSFPRLFLELFPDCGLDRTAVFRVAFNMLSFPSAPDAAPDAGVPGAPPLSVESLPGGGESAIYDLALSCRDDGDVLQCWWTGAADLFDPEDVAALGRDFEALLTRAVADPGARLSPSKETQP